MDRYQVGEVWASGQDYDSGVFQYFKYLSYKTNVSYVKSGQALDLGAGATLEVVWPEEGIEGQIFEDPNDQSIVLILEYNQTRVLLTGDIGAEEEKQILDVGDIDILKVGHQGSLTSSSPEFLRSIKPEVSIISVGENSYGHPSSIILDRLRMIGSQIFRTDTDGDIRILINKDGYQIKAFDL